jgi:hypothetical protein
MRREITPWRNPFTLQGKQRLGLMTELRIRRPLANPLSDCMGHYTRTRSPSELFCFCSDFVTELHCVAINGETERELVDLYKREIELASLGSIWSGAGCLRARQTF